MGAGRPSDYSDEIAEEICDRLSAGEPLAQICRDEHMPGLRTVYNWRDASEAFTARIAGAREAGFDQIAMDALHIADDNRHDTRYVGQDGEEREQANTEWITRSRLRVETRLKLLAKWDPKRYGDKQLIGSDPDNPLPSNATVILPTMTPQEAAEQYRKLIHG